MERGTSLNVKINFSIPSIKKTVKDEKGSTGNKQVEGAAQNNTHADHNIC